MCRVWFQIWVYHVVFFSLYVVDDDSMAKEGQRTTESACVLVCMCTFVLAHRNLVALARVDVEQQQQQSQQQHEDRAVLRSQT